MENVLSEKIEKLLSELKADNPDNQLLPLIRMKIEVSDLGILKTNTIINKFVGK
jgi:hypothetical protein